MQFSYKLTVRGTTDDEVMTAAAAAFDDHQQIEPIDPAFRADALEKAAGRLNDLHREAGDTIVLQMLGTRRTNPDGTRVVAVNDTVTAWIEPA